MRLIRITHVPPGEAPEHVREAWVGLTLPLAQVDVPQPHTCATVGVKTNTAGLLHRIRTAFRIPVKEEVWEGYIVEVIPAIAILHGSNPGAAAWWKRHTPYLFKNGEHFMFPVVCCEETSRVPA